MLPSVMRTAKIETNRRTRTFPTAYVTKAEGFIAKNVTAEDPPISQSLTQVYQI
jgi:hypothetical protein